MDSRGSEPAAKTPGSGTVVDARAGLALWLRAGRAQRKLTLEDVARVTKIQPRILEKLETGQLDGLPAEVFVKGFVRSFARCVGLDEREALDRYGACQGASPMVCALVSTMAELAPTAARQIKKLEPAPQVLVDVEPADATFEIEIDFDDAPATAVAEPAIAVTPALASQAATDADQASPPSPSKKKRGRRKKSTTGSPRAGKKKLVAPIADEPVAVASDATPSPAQPIERTPASTMIAELAPSDAPSTAGVPDATLPAEAMAEGSGPIDTTATATWRPTMPPIASTPSVPWRRGSFTSTSAPIVPTLVIDDADPDSAEREQEDRKAAGEPHRLSFLPPILLDRDDRSERQGGLTLAVIILLIAATLTLSYLMRRPSAIGNGVTMRETETSAKLG